jgi:hypothetical protein
MEKTPIIKDNPYNIAYYLVTDIQHIPPVIRLYPHLKGIVITENKQIYEHVNTKYKKYNIPCFYVKKRKEAHRIITKNKIRTVIYPSYHVIFRGKAIQIFHGGLSDKNYVESIKVTTYDMVLFPGEKTKDKIRNTGYLKIIPKWELVGYPKFDPLIDKSLEINPVFDNTKKTILYAPTWVSQNEKFGMINFSPYGESSLHIWAKDIISELHKDYNIIIKYHSRIYRKTNDIYDEIDKLIIELGAQKSVKVKIDDNILPFMYVADLMISDISTACYEWFHFNRPIIFANPSPEHYQPSNSINSNTYAWQAGDVINKKEDIKLFVDKNINNDTYKNKRNEIFNYTVYKPDGNATIRQADAIKEFIKKYDKKPYWLFILSCYIFRRYRRNRSKIINRYYKYIKRDKWGK